MDKMELFDASPDVFLIIAHDATVLDIVPFFPNTLNGWDVADNKALSTWRFLRDFEGATKQEK